MWPTIYNRIIYTGVSVTDQQPADIRSESIKQMCLTALEDMKALEIVTLDVRQQSTFTDTMIFASGTSSRHVSSIADSVAQTAKDSGTPALGVEGADIGEWVLVDLGDVIVHIMLPDIRRFYDLEKLWGEELLVS